MKCPHCWSTKLYLREVTPGKRLLLSCLLLVPVRCRHCYHKFLVWWFATIGHDIRWPDRSRDAGQRNAFHPAHVESRRAGSEGEKPSASRPLRPHRRRRHA